MEAEAGWGTRGGVIEEEEAEKEEKRLRWL
jgi:hypothetical protein